MTEFIPLTGADCNATRKGKKTFIEIYDTLNSMSGDEINYIDWEEFAEDNGLTYVDNGTSRAVFTHETDELIKGGQRCVVKIPQSSSFQNAMEVVNLNIANEIDREFATTRMAPIQDYGEIGKWSIMEMATSFVSRWDDMEEFRNYMKSSGWEIYDMSASNIGRFNGTIALLDYGLPFMNIEKSDISEEIYKTIAPSPEYLGGNNLEVDDIVKESLQGVRNRNVRMENGQLRWS